VYEKKDDKNIIKIEQPEISEDLLKECIDNFLVKGFGRFRLKLVFKNALNSGKEYKCFNRKELAWLMDNIDIIPRIEKSSLGSVIFYILIEEYGETIHGISKSIGSYTSPVRHWIKLLSDSNLLGSEIMLRGKGNRVYYGFNEGYERIIRLIFKRMVHTHNVNKLKKLSNINHDLQYKSILKNRAKNRGYF
jgi:hypothetical protein